MMAIKPRSATSRTGYNLGSRFRLDCDSSRLYRGADEFIPVSSTGHLLLAGHFLGFHSTNGTFEVLIQLGAVLAVLSVYFGRLWHLAITLPSSRGAGGSLAASFGVFARCRDRRPCSRLHQVGAFESPMTICVALLVGGVILLVIDALPLVSRYRNVEDYPLSLCLQIGLIQCLAMIPGTSRSGATIAGALLLGADKRSAAEFSFFLAMPTMAGAFAYDLFKTGALSAPTISH